MCSAFNVALTDCVRNTRVSTFVIHPALPELTMFRLRTHRNTQIRQEFQRNALTGIRILANAPVTIVLFIRLSVRMKQLEYYVRDLHEN